MKTNISMTRNGEISNGELNIFWIPYLLRMTHQSNLVLEYLLQKAKEIGFSNFSKFTIYHSENYLLVPNELGNETIYANNLSAFELAQIRTPLSVTLQNYFTSVSQVFEFAGKDYMIPVDKVPEISVHSASLIEFFKEAKYSF